MFTVRESGLTEDFDSFIPAVCTESPATGKAFCSEHSELVESVGHPSNLRAFLKSCSTPTCEVDPSTYNKTQATAVKEKLKEIARKIEDIDLPPSASSVGEAQGTTYYLRDRTLMNLDNFRLDGDAEPDACNK